METNKTLTFLQPKKTEDGEWVVRAMRDGRHYEPATYYTDNRADAVATRNAMVLAEEARVARSTKVVRLPE